MSYSIKVDDDKNITDLSHKLLRFIDESKQFLNVMDFETFDLRSNGYLQCLKKHLQFNKIVQMKSDLCLSHSDLSSFFYIIESILINYFVTSLQWLIKEWKLDQHLNPMYPDGFYPGLMRTCLMSGNLKHYTFFGDATLLDGVVIPRFKESVKQNQFEILSICRSFEEFDLRLRYGEYDTNEYLRSIANFRGSELFRRYFAHYTVQLDKIPKFNAVSVIKMLRYLSNWHPTIAWSTIGDACVAITWMIEFYRGKLHMAVVGDVNVLNCVVNIYDNNDNYKDLAIGVVLLMYSAESGSICTFRHLIDIHRQFIPDVNTCRDIIPILFKLDIWICYICVRYIVERELFTHDYDVMFELCVMADRKMQFLAEYLFSCCFGNNVFTYFDPKLMREYYAMTDSIQVTTKWNRSVRVITRLFRRNQFIAFNSRCDTMLIDASYLDSPHEYKTRALRSVYYLQCLKAHFWIAATFKSRNAALMGRIPNLFNRPQFHVIHKQIIDNGFVECWEWLLSDCWEQERIYELWFSPTSDSMLIDKLNSAPVNKIPASELVDVVYQNIRVCNSETMLEQFLNRVKVQQVDNNCVLSMANDDDNAENEDVNINNQFTLQYVGNDVVSFAIDMLWIQNKDFLYEPSFNWINIRNPYVRLRCIARLYYEFYREKLTVFDQLTAYVEKTIPAKYLVIVKKFTIADYILFEAARVDCVGIFIRHLSKFSISHRELLDSYFKIAVENGSLAVMKSCIFEDRGVLKALHHDVFKFVVKHKHIYVAEYVYSIIGNKNVIVAIGDGILSQYYALRGSSVIVHEWQNAVNVIRRFFGKLVRTNRPMVALLTETIARCKEFSTRFLDNSKNYNQMSLSHLDCLKQSLVVNGVELLTLVKSNIRARDLLLQLFHFIADNFFSDSLAWLLEGGVETDMLMTTIYGDPFFNCLGKRCMLLSSKHAARTDKDIEMLFNGLDKNKVHKSLSYMLHELLTECPSLDNLIDKLENTESIVVWDPYLRSVPDETVVMGLQLIASHLYGVDETSDCGKCLTILNVLKHRQNCEIPWEVVESVSQLLTYLNLFYRTSFGDKVADHPDVLPVAQSHTTATFVSTSTIGEFILFLCIQMDLVVIMVDMLDDISFVQCDDGMRSMLAHAIQCNSFGIIKHIVNCKLYVDMYISLLKLAMRLGRHHIAECLCRAVGNKVFERGVSMKDYYALRGSEAISYKWNNAANRLSSLQLFYFKKKLTAKLLQCQEIQADLLETATIECKVEDLYFNKLKSYLSIKESILNKIILTVKQIALFEEILYEIVECCYVDSLVWLLDGPWQVAKRLFLTRPGGLYGVLINHCLECGNSRQYSMFRNDVALPVGCDREDIVKRLRDTLNELLCCYEYRDVQLILAHLTVGRRMMRDAVLLSMPNNYGHYLLRKYIENYHDLKTPLFAKFGSGIHCKILHVFKERSPVTPIAWLKIHEVSVRYTWMTVYYDDRRLEAVTCEPDIAVLVPEVSSSKSLAFHKMVESGSIEKFLVITVMANDLLKIFADHVNRVLVSVNRTPPQNAYRALISSYHEVQMSELTGLVKAAVIGTSLSIIKYCGSMHLLKVEMFDEVFSAKSKQLNAFMLLSCLGRKVFRDRPTRIKQYYALNDNVFLTRRWTDAASTLSKLCDMAKIQRTWWPLTAEVRAFKYLMVKSERKLLSWDSIQEEYSMVARDTDDPVYARVTQLFEEVVSSGVEETSALNMSPHEKLVLENVSHSHTNLVTQSQSRPLDNVAWTVYVEKWKNKVGHVYRHFYEGRIKQLAEGERSLTVCKRLKGGSYPVWEAMLEKGARILWSKIRLDNVDFILIWYVCHHDDISTCLARINESYKRLSRQPHIRQQGGDEPVVELRETEMLVDPNGNSLLKLYRINRQELAQSSTVSAESCDAMKQPPLLLSAQQQAVNRNTGTVFLLGRSGTGKTLCLCDRMTSDSRYHIRQLFVCRSKRLCDFVRGYQEKSCDRDAFKNMQFMVLDDFTMFMQTAFSATPQPRCFSNKNKRVTFAFFESILKSHIFVNNFYCTLSPLILWQHIRTFIKGSIEAVLSGVCVSEKIYCSMEAFSRGRCRLSIAHRKEVYAVFTRYQNVLKTESMWDDADCTLDMLNRSQLKPMASHFDKVYVDEVQDNTQAEIVLYLLAAGMNTSALFLAGDPAQSVAEGVDFRFEEVRTIIYEFQKLSISDHGINSTVPKVISLTVNYRSHSGILDCAGAVLRAMLKMFPYAADTLKEDVGLVRGPRPNYCYVRNLDGLAKLLQKNEKLVVLCVSLKQVKAVREYLDSVSVINPVLVIKAAKGLEFSDVVIFDFFKTYTADCQLWKKLFTQPNVTESNALPHFELHLKLLYTAITRSCNRLIFVETTESNLSSVMFRWLDDSKLGEKYIADNETTVLMTGDEYRAKGIEFAQMAFTSNIEEGLANVEIALKYFRAAKDETLIALVSVQKELLKLYQSVCSDSDWVFDTKGCVDILAKGVKCGFVSEVLTVLDIVKDRVKLVSHFERTVIEPLKSILNCETC